MEKNTCKPSHCPRHALLELQHSNATTDEQRARIAKAIEKLLADCRNQGVVAVTVSNCHGEERDGRMCAVDWRQTGTTPLIGRGLIRPMIIGFNEKPAEHLLPPQWKNAI